MGLVWLKVHLRSCGVCFNLTHLSLICSLSHAGKTLTGTYCSYWLHHLVSTAVLLFGCSHCCIGHHENTWPLFAQWTHLKFLHRSGNWFFFTLDHLFYGQTEPTLARDLQQTFVRRSFEGTILLLCTPLTSGSYCILHTLCMVVEETCFLESWSPKWRITPPSSLSHRSVPLSECWQTCNLPLRLPRNTIDKKTPQKLWEYFNFNTITTHIQ